MRRRVVPALLAAAMALAGAPSLSPREWAWDALMRRLAGRFSSAAQAQADPDYLDVRWDAVVLWKDRTDGRWLYVERTVPGLPESPYRQTVYRMADEPGKKIEGHRFELAAYAIVQPGRFAGGAAEPGRLAAMTPADLVARPGCSIVLVRGPEDTLTGGTTGRDCPGDAPGVAYVTSEWTVGKDTLARWDRGFDADGRQVWGATKGPYVLRRVVASSYAEDAP